MKITLIHPSGKREEFTLKRGENFLRRKADRQVLALGWHLVGEQGGSLETDIPGAVVAALGLEVKPAMLYTPPEHQVEFMRLVAQYWLTNSEIAERTCSSLGAAEKWSGSPWAARHQPIPRGKLALLKASLRERPVAALPEKRVGRPRSPR